MTRIIKTASLFFLLTLLWAVAPGSAASGQTATAEAQSSRSRKETSVRVDNDNWNWVHRDDAVNLEVNIRGKVEFTDDYSDIKGVSDDGRIRVIDERGGTSRKFEAVAAPDGLKRSYWVNGESRPFDNEARRWLAKVLIDTVRQGGYDARPRVQRILREQGPNGVLQEISQLKGDYVKRIYFDELIKSGSLDDGMVRQVLRQAASEIKSDYEKAQLLIKISENYLHNDSQRAIYLEGVNTINSDYEKGRALSALLKKGELSRGNLSFLLKSVAAISSDYESAQLLIKIAEGFSFDDSSRAAYMDAVATINSDYEKGRVLSAFLKKADNRKEALIFTLKGASTISSDYEKAQLLIKVAAASSGDETVRAALIDTAKTIKSDYERGRVLNAVFK
ncbi:MAG TPA: hypothetical protein VF762_05100 [Blastocatellia bacterium]|jgi:hypothetical protein